jgi:hypothetical protein
VAASGAEPQAAAARQAALRETTRHWSTID